MHDGLRDHLTRTEICPFRASLTLLACAMRVQLARLERFLKHGAALPLFGASGEIRLILTGRCGRSVWRNGARLAKETPLVGRIVRIG